MRLLDHYEVIVRSLKQNNMNMSITITELSNILSCSHRNAKLIIRKLQDIGWVEWRPGRGRGHFSSITLLADFDLLVIDKAKEMAVSISIDDSINYLRRYSISDHVYQNFIDWIFYTFLHEKNDLPVDGIDRLRFPSYRQLPVLDPTLVNRRSENHIMRHVFSQLVTYDEATNMHLPHLAHYWRHNDPYTEWVFHLRKGVSFHHGKEMTAEDVCYSFQRHQSGSSAYHWIVNHMEQVDPVNKYTVKFNFSAPVPHFLHLVASLGGSIVPKEQMGNFNQIPIGTGPFQVKENTEDKLVLGAFKNQFSTRPFLDEVSMYFFPQLYDNQRKSSHTDEERINFYHYPYNRNNKDHFEQYTTVDRGSKLLTLNMNQGILSNDPLLRKAIFHFLMPEKLINELKGNRFVPASRMLAEFEEKEPFARDVSIAMDCLERSLYNGEELTLLSYTGAGNELDGKWIQEQLNQAGIQVSLQFKPYEDLHNCALAEEADMLLGEQLSDESILYTFLSSFKGEHSLLAHHLPECVRTKIASLTEHGGTERTLLTSMQEIEADLVDQYGHIHLYRLQQFAICPTYFEGIHINAIGWVDYSKLWYNQ